MDETNKPQPKPIKRENVPACWDLVIEDMKERDRTGEQKYGVRLQPFNGRNSLIDAYQEGLDLVVYLRQHLFEMRMLRQLLWICHGCPSAALYGDDGEMQCPSCKTDFLRDPIPEIERKVLSHRLADPSPVSTAIIIQDGIAYRPAGYRYPFQGEGYVAKDGHVKTAQPGAIFDGHRLILRRLEK